MTFSPRNSRPPTPSKSRSYLYSPTYSRSKSSLPQPKVLPFPDIPIKPLSHESSRSASPYHSPAPTRRSSSQDVARLRRVTDITEHTTLDISTVHVNTSNSNLSVENSSDSLPQLASPVSPPLSAPISPGAPPISSNMEAGPSRLRSSTTPSSAGRPIPVPPVLNLNAPNRTHGFNPVPITPPAESNLSPHSASPLPPSALRASSLPTSAPVTSNVSRLPIPVKKLSNPPASPILPGPTAAQITPVPSQQVLSDHMYQSFLKGTCADVCLYVKKWGVGWYLHKMVLVQAGFFHSMFLGGFSEMNGKTPTVKGKERAIADDNWHGEEIELVFDDPNITRAAFEICLSRLYSPHPHLHFPSILLTTPQSPLSPSFSEPGWAINLESLQSSLPPQAVLATPRLLLSILATTIYLGHATLMREALAMVLRTVGPGTVGRYLAFAVGDGIGEEEWEGQTASGAPGLATVAKQVRKSVDSSVNPVPVQPHSMPVSTGSSSQSLSDDGTKVGNVPLPTVSERSTPTLRHELALGMSLSRQVSATPSLSDLPHFYGFASNKLGEACTCWLARWGVDVLNIELASVENPTVRIWSHRGLSANFVCAVLSSDAFFVRDEMERYMVARKILDLRRKGWEQELEGREGSSLHESIGESENLSWEAWEEDEEELAKVFASGIYYTHMTFDDLSYIASDIDPTTSLPFVPLPVLQAAHWAAADLRNKILAPKTSENDELGLTTTASALAAPDQKRRRVTPRSRQVSTSQSTLSLASMHDATSNRSDVYHPIPVDDTHRIGAGGVPFLTALATATNPLPGMPGLPDLGPEIDSYSVEGARPAKFRPPPQGEKTAFGLLRGCRTVSELLEEHALSLSGLTLSDTTTQKWTKAEPYRFSVEFWGVDKLVEKERAYSTTHFYAGSWFNVYVQTIRKKDKGTQLGIYLHRQNPSEPFPTPSAPKSALNSTKNEETETEVVSPTLGSSGGLGLVGGTRMYRAMSVPPATMGTANVGHVGQPNLGRNPSTPLVGSPTSPINEQTNQEGKSNEAIAPYKDARKVTKAYFSISCASALGTALIRFSSTPDTFTISQSWGWKSSALRSEEYLTNLDAPGGMSGGGGGGGGGQEENLDTGVLGWVGESGPGRWGKEGSLRATVVVGVV